MVKELLKQVYVYRLSVPTAFKRENIETLEAVYNGIGPEHWNHLLRGIITALFLLFAPAALVHDYEFSVLPKNYKHFTQANCRLAYNCIRLALFGKLRFFKNTLHSRLKLAGLGLLLAILCQLFGQKSYNNKS